MLLLDFTKILLAPGRRGVLRYPCKRAAGPLWDLVPSAPQPGRRSPTMRTHRCRFACFTIAQWEKEAAWLRQRRTKKGVAVHPPHRRGLLPLCRLPAGGCGLPPGVPGPEGPGGGALQSLRRRGWAYVDRFTQYFYFRKPAKDISPEEAALLQNPAAQLGMVRRVFWGRMFPCSLWWAGCSCPSSSSPAGGPHRGPPLCPGAGGLWGRLSPVRPAVSPGRAGRFSPACLPRPTAGGDAPRKTGVLYHIAPPRATARGRVFPWRPPLLA